MKKATVLGILAAFLFLGFPGHSMAQGSSSAGAKLEAIFKGAQMPFVKLENDHYKAVVTIGENESDGFQVFLQTIGNDPNDESLQVMQMVFFLGTLPKGATPSAALMKQINTWNGSLSRGSVFVMDSMILYQSSAWLSKSDPTTLINDAMVGHFTSQQLRKEIQPYIKE